MQATISAIANLTFLNEDLCLGFGFCKLYVKKNDYKCIFDNTFLNQMQSKYNEKLNLCGTVKDIWAKSWTLPSKKPLAVQNQNSTIKQSKITDVKYLELSNDLFNIKQATYTK